MVGLSFVCAFILSILASVLAKPQELAKELDRSKQMMIAAHILDHAGFFHVEEKEGKSVIAKVTPEGILIADPQAKPATNAQIFEMYKKRFQPLLVDDKGDVHTFPEMKVNEEEYMTQYKKQGYYKVPLRLIYAILPDMQSSTETDKAAENMPIGYVIPINGFGLWDAVYGYLAIKPDGNSVIGTSWYDQKETPGLGANISEAPWQDLFPGKKIFQESPGGTTDFKTAPLGITVVKGKVIDVLGDTPKAKSAVDGMAGATLTGNGVTDAYRDVLAAYRPFLMKLAHKSSDKGE
jgi:Na+-transporting NADH:ubiquinone oxidoreductase subunit C